jgi:cell division transport system ATP-binding protein
MITFSEVTKRFGDGTVALDKVSFHIEPGELVVITGPSGSGKTTIMRLLIRDFLPTEGDITYKGESIVQMPSAHVPFHRRKIGVVFQDYRLLSELNVWENIALPLSILGKPEEEIESRVTDLLNLISVADRALVFPKQLSGGEAQRVSIARALATGPSVIFADEPTGNLDKNASLSIVKLLQQINSLGTTVLIATHDVTLLDYLENERQLDLNKGKLEHDSRPSSAPAKPKVEVDNLDELAEKPAEKMTKVKDHKKSEKKKIIKKDKHVKVEPAKEESELADEFKPVEAKPTPPKKSVSWLKKLSGGLQGKFGQKEAKMKPAEKPEKTEVVEPEPDREE